MAIKSIAMPDLKTPAEGALPPRISRALRTARDYWVLTKPEVNVLIAITATTGFLLAVPAALAHLPIARLGHVLIGTLLAASGTAAMNQYIERCYDAQMRRTARRPLAAGRVSERGALGFGIALSLIGPAYLAVFVNVVAAVLAAITSISYLTLYTPLKRKTSLSVLIGSLVGALPPLIGWAGASGELNAKAWLLYSIVFLWQFPHVMAIAWMYREDYARAGYALLPRSGDEAVRLMKWQCLLPATGLIIIPSLSVMSFHAWSLFALAAALLGVTFLWMAARLTAYRTNLAARHLLQASILYLPLLCALLLLAKERGI